MLSLIIKDVLVQKKQFLFAILYLGFLVVAFQSFGEIMFSVAIVAFVYMLNMTACANEDKVNADIMLNSLPIKRANIVIQKYISIYIYFAIGTATYIIFTKLFQLLNLPIRTYSLTYEVFIGGFVALSFMAALYFPLYFKFGYMKMRVVNFVLFFLIFFGTTFLARHIQDANSLPFLNGIMKLLDKDGLTIAIGAVVFYLILMLISVVLAIYFYKKREF